MVWAAAREQGLIREVQESERLTPTAFHNSQARSVTRTAGSGIGPF